MVVNPGRKSPSSQRCVSRLHTNLSVEWCGGAGGWCGGGAGGWWLEWHSFSHAVTLANGQCLVAGHASHFSSNFPPDEDFTHS